MYSLIQGHINYGELLTTTNNLLTTTHKYYLQTTNKILWSTPTKYWQILNTDQYERNFVEHRIGHSPALCYFGQRIDAKFGNFLFTRPGQQIEKLNAYSISSSSYILHLRCIYSSDFLQKCRLWFLPSIYARKSSTRSQQQHMHYFFVCMDKYQPLAEIC